MTTFTTIVADPPWAQPTVGAFKSSRHSRPDRLPYPTMELSAITTLPVESFAAEGAHLWLWTTNAYLEASFGVMRAWGFKYLTTITWVKPSGMGAYFAGTTQHCLFGYYKKCRFPLARWRPTDFRASVKRHSEKPEAFYDLVESVSPGPRLELFARKSRPGWAVWGNEVACDIEMGV